LWRRASTDRQRTDNQTPVLDHFVKHLGYEVVKTYDLDDSAWNGGKKNGEYRAALKQRWTTRGAASTRCS
jgi:DNA invertase Pin-like site-specific DNA recombinase